MKEIDIAGADIEELRFKFTNYRRLREAARVRKLENSPFGGLISTLYYDWYWYLAFSEERIKKAMRGEWGKVFEKYRR